MNHYHLVLAASNLDVSTTTTHESQSSRRVLAALESSVAFKIYVAQGAAANLLEGQQSHHIRFCSSGGIVESGPTTLPCVELCFNIQYQVGRSPPLHDRLRQLHTTQHRYLLLSRTALRRGLRCRERQHSGVDISANTLRAFIPRVERLGPMFSPPLLEARFVHSGVVVSPRVPEYYWSGNRWPL